MACRIAGVSWRTICSLLLRLGPAWLSGGSVGPEGSVLVLPIILLLALSVRFTLPHTPVADLQRLRASNVRGAAQTS